jgi:Methyltransferase domain
VTDGTPTLRERLEGAGLQAIELLTVALGLRLGLYAALRDTPSTAAQLAARAGILERYAREWLEQQAVAGLLTHADGVFSLPDDHARTLLEVEDPSFAGGTPRTMAAVAGVLDAITDAYRAGEGLPFGGYGPEFRAGLAANNRREYVNHLASWLAAVPGLGAPARIADVGCGEGWSSFALAAACAGASVDGIDLDEASVLAARRAAQDRGLDGRVTFHLRDAADPGLAGRYDLVCAFETIHDMGDPVGALRAMRSLRAPGATVLVVDERCADHFDPAAADERERSMYGYSVLHCLPVSVADAPTPAQSAATGTCMRASVFTGYALAAGFAAVDVLDIEHDQWRFYCLT